MLSASKNGGFIRASTTSSGRSVIRFVMWLGSDVALSNGRSFIAFGLRFFMSSDYANSWGDVHAAAAWPIRFIKLQNFE